MHSDFSLGVCIGIEIPKKTMVRALKIGLNMKVIFLDQSSDMVVKT